MNDDQTEQNSVKKYQIIKRLGGIFSEIFSKALTKDNLEMLMVNFDKF